MKILLIAINAKYIHSNPAIYSLKAYAKAYGASIELAEFTINHRSEYILREIYKKNPDVVCFSCYIWNYEYVREIAAQLHKLKKEVPIWVGGPEVSFETEAALIENPAFFGVMIGEGEATFAELAEYYCKERKGSLSEIAGIAYRKCQGAGGPSEICHTAKRETLDFNSVPFACEEIENFMNRIVYYESSRGCPFSCSYCLSSVEKKLRFRELSLVRRELSFLMEQEAPQVKFVDRTFNCSHNHAMEIWKFIRDRDNGVTNFHFEIAADLLTEEELEFLSALRPGLIQLEIGIQSVNLVTIREIRRTMDLSKVKAAVKRIGEAGNIHMHLDLIAGLPYEDFQSFAQSFREIYALKPNQLQLGFLKVLKGSYLYENRDAYGILYHDKPPYEVMRTNWLSYEEILFIKLVEEMVEVYYNSGQFEVTMKLLDAVYPDSFAFFLSLGRFYEQKGYLDRKHSRMQRTEILREFLLKEGKMPKALTEEALLYDLYYRENMKSRPAWARSPREFSKITKRFCKNGTQSHIEPFYYHFPKKETKKAEELPKRLSECVYVLFEYEKRDALSHQAKATELTNQEVEEQWENAPMKF